MPETLPDLWLPPRGTVICPAEAVEPEETRGFVISDPRSDNSLDLIIWHTQGRFRGFVNRCPHLGLPLETFPDRFLSALGDALVCSAHGALFDATGNCLAGPCKGDKLIPLELAVHDRVCAEPADEGEHKDIVLIGRLAHS